jgi:hypothetical protein
VEPDISTLLGTRRRQTVELYASRHIFPACNRVSQRAGVHNRKISTGLDSQVECGFAAERKASCEPFNSSFVYSL